MTRKLSVLLLFFVLTAGCSYIGFYTCDRQPNRVHKLGMKLYNYSKEDIGPEQWEVYERIIELAYTTFYKCAKLTDEIAKIVRHVPIVVSPSANHSDHKHYLAFTDLQTVFIKKNYFTESNLRHEWIHIVLNKTGKSMLGDPFHRNPLFKKCEQLP